MKDVIFRITFAIFDRGAKITVQLEIGHLSVARSILLYASLGSQ